MVTTVVQTIGDTGTFADIAAWEAATDIDLTLATGSDEIRIGELQDQAHEVFMNSTIISGAVTDSTNYRMLRPQNARFQSYSTVGPVIYAKLQNGASLDEVAIEINEDYFRMQGIGLIVEARRLEASGTDSGLKTGLRVKSSNVLIDGVFCKMSEGGKVGDSLAMQCFEIEGTGLGGIAADSYMINCTAVGSSYPIGGQGGYLTGNYVTGGGFYNCVAVDFTRNVGRGFLSLGITQATAPVLVNCISINCQSACFSGLWSRFEYLVSSDSTARAQVGYLPVDSNGLSFVSSTSCFVNPAALDFRLKLSSPAVASGSNETVNVTDIAGEAVDAEGTARAPAWERGAYEGASAGPTTAITVVTNTIGPGMDYTDISDWLTATEVNCYYLSTQYVGLVADKGTPYNVDDTGGGTGTYRVQRANTTPSFFRTLKAASNAERYNPVGTSGVYIKGDGGAGNGNNIALDIREDYFRLEGVGVEQDDTGGSSHVALALIGNNCRLDSVFIRASSGTGSSTYCVRIKGRGNSFWNCIAKGDDSGSNNGASVGFLLGSTDQTTIYNCIAADITHGAGHGFEEALGSAGSTITNCIGVGNILDFQHGTGQVAGVTQSYNISEGISAAGPGSQVNVSPALIFKDTAANDFRLIASSPALNAGANLILYFSTDYSDSQRFAPFDIGIYEGFAAAPLYVAVDPSGQETHHTVTLYEIVRPDGFTLYLTDANAPIVFKGQVFESSSSVQVSAHRKEVSLKDSSTQYLGAITSDKITVEDLAARLYKGTRVLERRIDHRFPFASPLATHVYTMEETAFDGSQWRADLAGIGARLSVSVGENVVHSCGYVLGAVGSCNALIDAFTQDGVAVTSITNLRNAFEATAIPGGAPYIDDYFGYGEFVWLSGNNFGVEARVKSYTETGTAIVLDGKTPFDIEVGDTFRMKPGCRRRYITDCIAKHNNGINYGGEPYLPRTDKTLQTPVS
jgi:uncharacterized phage protein (TIGR02218 family)